MNFKKIRKMITVNGNEKLVVKEFKVSSFLNLHISISGLVELIQSEEEKVEVETDENLFKYISVANSGKTLFINSDAGYRKLKFTNLKTKVFLRQINKLYIRCEDGDVICNNMLSIASALEVRVQSTGNTDLKLEGTSLKILIQCKGDVRLSGKCFEAEIKSQADGGLFAKELITENLKIKNMSTGNIEVFANKTISIAHYGEGFIHYYGDARLADINQKGIGEIKHLK